MAFDGNLPRTRGALEFKWASLAWPHAPDLPCPGHSGDFKTEHTTAVGTTTGTIYVGAQGFSPKDWVGTFYPPRFSPSQFLPFYARVFDTVEVNSTFYAIPSASTIRSWFRRTPDHFIFSCKMPQEITHDQRLVGVEDRVALFVERMRGLGDKLGPVVIQFPRSFTREFEDRLRSFLPLLPTDLRFAVEFRSQSWHDAQIWELLKEHNLAWCINDWQDLPTVVKTTTDFAYLRLVGYHREFQRLDEVQRDRSEELTSWAATITDLASQLPRVHVYVNNHYEGHAPSTINKLAELLGLPTIDPKSLWPEQSDLFTERAD